MHRCNGTPVKEIYRVKGELSRWELEWSICKYSPVTSCSRRDHARQAQIGIQKILSASDAANLPRMGWWECTLWAKYDMKDCLVYIAIYQTNDKCWKRSQVQKPKCKHFVLQNFKYSLIVSRCFVWYTRLILALRQHDICWFSSNFYCSAKKVPVRHIYWCIPSQKSTAVSSKYSLWHSQPCGVTCKLL